METSRGADGYPTPFSFCKVTTCPPPTKLESPEAELFSPPPTVLRMPVALLA